MMLFFAIIWSIWFLRNQCIFEGYTPNWEHFSFIIKLRLGFLIKAKFPDIPYSPGAVVTNLEAVRTWRRSRIQRPMISWYPPPEGTIKWNVDGSARGKPGEAGIGEILRDANGITLCTFFSYVGIRDANEAEFMAIVFALETTLQREDFQDKKILVESDSKNALSWVRDKNNIPWELRFYGKKLSNLLVVIKEVHFTHQRREANMEADHLAKFASTEGGTSINWDF